MKAGGGSITEHRSVRLPKVAVNRRGDLMEPPANYPIITKLTLPSLYLQ